MAPPLLSTPDTYGPTTRPLGADGPEHIAGRRCCLLCADTASIVRAETRGDQVVDSDKVSEVIEVIRPAIQADAGDIFLRGVDGDP